ncbi:MAG: hypothetical protein WKF36_02520 [Candidatus Nitrosocosmicus sp.]
MSSFDILIFKTSFIELNFSPSSLSNNLASAAELEFLGINICDFINV